MKDTPCKLQYQEGKQKNEKKVRKKEEKFDTEIEKIVGESGRKTRDISGRKSYLVNGWVLGIVKLNHEQTCNLCISW